MSDKKYNEILLKYLNNEEYKAFLIEISNMPITKDNYEEYMSIIKSVLSENRNDKEIPFKSSGDILIETFSDKKDLNYFDIEKLLKKAIKSHFITSLKLDTYVDEDKKIIEELENFESGFNY